MQPTPSSVPQRRLARQARQKFVEGICAPDSRSWARRSRSSWPRLMTQTGTAREMQSHRDAWMRYQHHCMPPGPRSHRQGLAAMRWRPHSSSTRGALASQWRKPPVRAAQRRCGGEQDPGLAHGPDDHRTGRASSSTHCASAPSPWKARNSTAATSFGRTPCACCWWSSGWNPACPAPTCRPWWTHCSATWPTLLQKHYQAVNVFYVEQGITPQTDLKSRVRRTGRGADHRQRWEQRLRGRRPGLPGPGADPGCHGGSARGHDAPPFPVGRCPSIRPACPRPATRSTACILRLPRA